MIQIFENSNIHYTLTEYDFVTNYVISEYIVSRKWYEQISEYICIKKFTRTNIWIYSYKKFDSNECPNKYSYWKLCEYSNILEYSSSFYTLTHSRTNVRIYSYKQIWRERISEYICLSKFDTRECSNKYLWPKYSNIRIYSSHSGLDYDYDDDHAHGNDDDNFPWVQQLQQNNFSDSCSVWAWIRIWWWWWWWLWWIWWWLW